MLSADFHFELPSELVAQKPAIARDESRLLVMHRGDGLLEHRQFKELTNYLYKGDVLVLNNSKVIPARLRAVNSKTGGAFEVLLLEENHTNDWWAMLRPGKRAPIDTRIEFKDRSGQPTTIQATITATNQLGHRRLRFEGVKAIAEQLDAIGEMPVPPYINRESQDEQLSVDFERYQTVFAKFCGSVAAPTAGLHFTEALLDQVRRLGVHVCFVTLHVGPGTFAPVKTEEIANHVMHGERYVISPEAAEAVNKAKAEQRRVFSVGTTSLRVLESVAAQNAGRILPSSGLTRMFIHPPYRFQIVDALVTNFHLPCSTLLMLASAFAAPGEVRGRELMLRAYAGAVAKRYRFFSYGDAMLIL